MRKILEQTDNPREIIYLSKALELLNDYESLPIILKKCIAIEYEHLDRELTLIASSFLGINQWFSYYFSLFLTDQDKAYRELSNEIPDNDINYDLNKRDMLISSHLFKITNKDEQINKIITNERIMGKSSIHFLLFAFAIYDSYFHT